MKLFRLTNTLINTDLLDYLFLKFISYKMTESERKTIKKWIAVWQEAGKALREIKIKELRADDYYEKNKQLLSEMLQYDVEHRTVRLTSGLVEQQRYFMKLREKSNKKSKEE